MKNKLERSENGLAAPSPPNPALHPVPPQTSFQTPKPATFTESLVQSMIRQVPSRARTDCTRFHLPFSPLSHLASLSCGQAPALPRMGHGFLPPLHPPASQHTHPWTSLLLDYSSQLSSFYKTSRTFLLFPILGEQSLLPSCDCPPPHILLHTHAHTYTHSQS